MTRRALAGLVVVTAVAACVDFSGTVDPTFGLPDVVVETPTLAQDVQPILDRRCAYGGCHSVASRQAGLVLVADSSHAATVGRPSRLRPSRILVFPGSPDNSWLLELVSAEDEFVSGFPRMPLAATPLTANQIATIRRWIARGAPR